MTVKAILRHFSDSRLAKFLFWAAALFALVMALIPHPPGATLLPDKVQHAMAFGVLGVLGTYAYPRWWAAWLIVGLSIFGALIEVAQGTALIHRDADPLDWVTDTVACAVVVIALHWWAARRR
jgi:hypothetical protein